MNPVEINIDYHFLFWLVGISATIIGLLLVALAKMTIKGFHQTLYSCHDKLEQRIENHETRITQIEHAVFKPANGFSDNN